MANPKAEGLNRKERQAIALLSIGTLLEFFDLYLYVHLAVKINESFFPQTNELTAKLLGILAFSMTFILRPIGGVIIGRLGDIIGRKPIILITNFIMAISCIMIAVSPSYEKIGISSAIILMIARIIQGFSSIGEIIGAKVYIVEILGSPNKFIASSIIGVCSQIGVLFAILVGYIVISNELNWRYAFIAGAFIAIIGFIARVKLFESAAFLKNRQKLNRDKNFINKDILASNKKSAIAFFVSQFNSPFCISVTYLYLADYMKHTLNMTSEQIIGQNLKISIFTVIFTSVLTICIRKVHPIKLCLWNVALISVLMLAVPFLLNITSGLLILTIVQIITFGLTLCSYGIFESVAYSNFPVKYRFTISASAFGVANPIAMFVIPFSLVLLTDYLGYWAIVVIFAPVATGFYFAAAYFRSLEIKKGNYHHYPYKDEDVEADIHPYNYELGEEYIPYQKECKCSKRLIDMLESINKTAKKEVNIRLVEKAIAFAKKWHDGQKRKTGEPYYTHPLAVAMMTAQYKFKTHMVVAAILHDVVEDSKCTVELISKEFTPRIAEIVELLTREYNGKKLSIAETIKRIFGAEDYEALLIKGLDRVHNLQTIHGMKSKKQKEIAEETIYEIANVAAYAVDDLNINDKRKLERKLYKLSNKALKKSQISMNK